MPSDPNDGRTRGPPPLDPARREAVRGEEARVRREEVRIEEGLARNDRRHRAVIPLVAGILIAAALALIWRWIS